MHRSRNVVVVGVISVQELHIKLYTQSFLSTYYAMVVIAINDGRAGNGSSISNMITIMSSVWLVKCVAHATRTLIARKSRRYICTVF